MVTITVNDHSLCLFGRWFPALWFLRSPLLSNLTIDIRFTPFTGRFSLGRGVFLLFVLFLGYSLVVLFSYRLILSLRHWLVLLLGSRFASGNWVFFLLGRRFSFGNRLVVFLGCQFGLKCRFLTVTFDRLHRIMTLMHIVSLQYVRCSMSRGAPNS